MSDYFPLEEPCPRCEKVRQLQNEAQVEVTWTWPATVAFIAVLLFISFLVWVFFG